MFLLDNEIIVIICKANVNYLIQWTFLVNGVEEECTMYTHYIWIPRPISIAEPEILDIGQKCLMNRQL